MFENPRLTLFCFFNLTLSFALKIFNFPNRFKIFMNVLTTWIKYHLRNFLFSQKTIMMGSNNYFSSYLPYFNDILYKYVCKEFCGVWSRIIIICTTTSSSRSFMNLFPFIYQLIFGILGFISLSKS